MPCSMAINFRYDWGFPSIVVGKASVSNFVKSSAIHFLSSKSGGESEYIFTSGFDDLSANGSGSTAQAKFPCITITQNIISE